MQSSRHEFRTFRVFYTHEEVYRHSSFALLLPGYVHSRGPVGLAEPDFSVLRSRLFESFGMSVIDMPFYCTEAETSSLI